MRVKHKVLVIGFTMPLISVLMGLTTLPAAQAQATIDQTAEFAVTAAGFGTNNDAIVGQTFTAPSDPVLTDFSMRVDSFAYQSPTPQVEMVYHVARWFGPDAGLGADLATSSPFLTPTTDYSDQFYTFTPIGGLVLTPGVQYMAYLTSVKDPRYTGTTAMPESFNAYFAVGHDYTGGSLFDLPSGPGGAWYDLQSDATFRADFAAPEPSQFAALGLGGLALGGMILRARKKAQA